MLRVTDDVLELRSWAEERGGQPCRQPDGRLAFRFGPDLGDALHVGWDEFEAAFVHARRAFVYDDSPGCTQCFVGTSEEARAFVVRYAPHLTGPAPTHPPHGG
ncbi:MAG TPA: hypothetical protein VFP65_28320 [Anaeromyxobacteraceae bacterium]|nr:hypothetical protein [Anaeromyxobacteraceae bacterium]